MGPITPDIARLDIDHVDEDRVSTTVYIDGTVRRTRHTRDGVTVSTQSLPKWWGRFRYFSDIRQARNANERLRHA